MRQLKWTTTSIVFFLKEHDIKLKPSTDVAGIKHVVPWQCLICGKEHETTFDHVVLQHSAHASDPRSYHYCPHCRAESKANLFDEKSLTSKTEDAAFLSGLISARKIKIVPKHNRRQAKTIISANTRQTLKTIASRIGTDAKTVRLYKSFAITIENDSLAKMARSMSDVPSESNLARAWTRGYFERRGAVCMFSSDGKKNYRITVTGKRRILDSILKAFNETGQKRGKVQHHARKSGDTWELHFSGHGCSMKFLEWMGRPPEWFVGNQTANTTRYSAKKTAIKEIMNLSEMSDTRKTWKKWQSWSCRKSLMPGERLPFQERKQNSTFRDP